MFRARYFVRASRSATAGARSHIDRLEPLGLRSVRPDQEILRAHDPPVAPGCFAHDISSEHRARRQPAPDRTSIDWSRSDYDPYARTKKFCEHMIRQLLPDVSRTIFRPSIVLGDSRRPIAHRSIGAARTTIRTPGPRNSAST